MIISVLQVSTQPQGLKSSPKVTSKQLVEKAIFLESLYFFYSVSAPGPSARSQQSYLFPLGNRKAQHLCGLSCHSFQLGPTAPENPQMHLHDPLSTSAYRHTHSYQHGLRTNAVCTLWLSLFKGRKKETDETTDVFKSC